MDTKKTYCVNILQTKIGSLEDFIYSFILSLGGFGKKKRGKI